jgi:hypothetical protein
MREATIIVDANDALVVALKHFTPFARCAWVGVRAYAGGSQRVQGCRPCEGIRDFQHSAEPLQACHNHSLRKNNEPEANPRACLHSLFLDTQGVRQSRELG